MGSISNAYTSKGDSEEAVVEDVTHQTVSSYFIGPLCENLPFFRKNIDNILNELEKARLAYFPKDGRFITESIQRSDAFKKSTRKLEAAVTKTAELLGKHSLPFWSPRYEGHMSTDVSMASLLAYFATSLYNPNNVALEASPITTVAEIEAGLQLCKLFGYNVDPLVKNLPMSWGHVTCDGTIANLESIWVSRNLKFYPLSLHRAMGPGKELSFVADSFEVRTCQGGKKKFVEMKTWELLNLQPTTVLDLPDRLYKEFGISPKFLEKVMTKYTIQSTGKDILEQEFGIDKPPQIMLAKSRHYSWPKGGAIAGIGSDNVVGIELDNAARVEMGDLEAKLQNSLDNEQAVYQVTAIIGSTEEGAVDPLVEILALRRKFQAKGLSFNVHADAAWGGYFCTMLPTNYNPGDIVNVPQDVAPGDGFVPDVGLRAQTQEDLYAMRFADSITVDPHKAGYVQYPAGGLCYRDERMRFLITWTSPYLSRGSTTSIGIFGVEGSKPGAAAMATWLTNTCIGLEPDGYGSLMSEVCFTCSRFSAEYAAMSRPEDNFIVVPFNELPSELKQYASDEERIQAVEAEKEKIRTQILGKTNAEVAVSQENMALLRALGSDLNINAFAINWRYSDGTLNDDIEELNYLTTRVIEALSIDKPTDDPTKLPLVLTSTAFEHELYGDCALHFQKRLGIRESLEDLSVLRNVVMSPFPTERNFVGMLAGIFRDTVEREIEFVRKRNEETADHHDLLMQGTEQIYLVHYPMFYEAKHRRQCILALDLPPNVKSDYVALKRASPGEAFSFVTAGKIVLSDLLSGDGELFGSIKSNYSGVLMRNIPARITKVVKDRPLRSRFRDHDYPDRCPFYLYGSGGELHLDHVLAKAPNAQLSAEAVQWAPDDGSGDLADADLADGMIALATEIYEAAMQPFSPNDELAQSTVFFFRPGARLRVDVHKDPKAPDAEGPGLLDADALGSPVASGVITLGEGLYVDADGPNKDPFPRVEKYNEWKREFDRIGQSMED